MKRDRCASAASPLVCTAEATSCRRLMRGTAAPATLEKRSFKIGICGFLTDQSLRNGILCKQLRCVCRPRFLAKKEGESRFVCSHRSDDANIQQGSACLQVPTSSKIRLQKRLLMNPTASVQYSPPVSSASGSGWCTRPKGWLRGPNTTRH